jgi:hypothetical protein
MIKLKFSFSKFLPKIKLKSGEKEGARRGRQNHRNQKHVVPTPFILHS